MKIASLKALVKTGILFLSKFGIISLLLIIGGAVLIVYGVHCMKSKSCNDRSVRNAEQMESQQIIPSDRITKKFCSSCGAVGAMDDKFCQVCGRPLESEQLVSTETSEK